MRTSRRVVAFVCTALAVAAMPLPAQAQYAPAHDVDRQHATAAVAHLPIRFEPTDHKGRLLARGIGPGVRLNGRSIDFPLGTDADRKGSIRVEFVGARKSSHVTGADPLPGRVNYLYGQDPSRWRTNVPTYARAHTKEIYRGIDVDYYGADDFLEYDFIVRPGARSDAIRLRISGQSVAISDDGDLVYGSGRRVLLRNPVAYQNIDGVRRTVAVDYRRHKDGTFGFAIGAYDQHEPLVIDPVVAYVVTLSGSSPGSINDIAVDDVGAIYVGGETSSANFQAVRPAGSPVDAGARADGFLAKITADGSALDYATYFGQSGWDHIDRIAIDANHALHFVGNRTFDTGSSVLYGSYLGKLTPDGTRFEYTFVTPDFNYFYATSDLTVGPDGAAYVVTTSQPGGAQRNEVSTLSPAGDNYHAIFTLTEPDWRGRVTSFSTITASSDSLFVGGSTLSSSFPTTTGAAQTVLDGSEDGLVIRLTAQGAVLYSTLVGFGDFDGVRDLAVDADGSAYVVGNTGGVLCLPPNYGQAFIARLSPDGGSISSAVVRQYHWGCPAPAPLRIALDAAANAYTVTCSSGNLGIGSYPSGCDLWKISPTGTVLRSELGVPSSTFAIDPSGISRWYGLDSDMGVQVVKFVPAITVRSLTPSTSLPSRFAQPITWMMDVLTEEDVEYGFSRYDGSSGWVDVQPFGPNPSYSWTPSSWDVGDHTLCAVARLVRLTTRRVSKCVAFTITGVAPGETAVTPPAADFSADRRPDLIWVNEATGELAAWNMGGGTYGERVVGGGYLNTTPLPAGWRVVGTGDVDGDGHTDIFLQSDAGLLGVWFFGSWTLRNGLNLTPAQVTDTNWKVRAVGDFNDDGHPDLVWQYRPTGQLAFWLMNGTQAIDFVVPDIAAPGADWEIVGSGDSNRDGERDLFWQKRSTGTLAVWRMHGTTLAGGAYLSASPSDPKWRVAAVADLDGDAYSDLVLQQTDTGALAAWYLRDSSVRFDVLLNPSSVSPNSWKIAGPR
jgi:hypothetical protein